MSTYPDSPSRPVAQIATGVPSPHSLEAERSVLGGLLISDRPMAALRMEEGLVAEHFFRDGHRLIFEAMCRLHDAGHSIDVLTVTEMLRDAGRLDAAGGRAAIDDMSGGVPQLGGVRRYAQIVTAHWVKRQTLSATYAIQAGVLNHDDEQIEAGRRMLDDTVVAFGASDGCLGPNALGSHMLDWLAEEPEEGLPLPVWLPSLARMVRLRPGHTTVLAAWPSHGKTALAMNLAEAFGAGGNRTVVWSNEDTREELVAKHVMSVTGIPASIISDRRVKDARMAGVVKELGRLPFEVQPCADWDAAQVAAHIRQVRPAVAVLDHFHNLSKIGTTAEVDESVRALAAAALQTGCHLVLCAQLNRSRLNGVCLPPPVAGDLRGSGMFLAACHTMLLVHRDEEEMEDESRGKLGKATQLPTGGIDVAKNKVTGKRGLVRTTWDETTLRHVEQARSSDAPAAGADPDAWLR